MRFSITIEGTAPLLMHSCRLSDPFNETKKAISAITGKRKKTDEDHMEISRLEHFGSLYLDPDLGPYIPGENIARCLVDSGKLNRQGPAVIRGVFIDSDVNPIAYNGPRDAKGLWNDENFRLISSVKLQGKRLQRCRPLFPTWKTQATGVLDESILSIEEISLIAKRAGELIGLGDWRPRYGRFVSQVEWI
jgi:hypothetical protein